MSTAGPWSVKGIDPKAREIAKDLARRSGLTLGEWLNQMITDTADEPPPPAYAERELETAGARGGWPDAPPARAAAPAAALSPPAASAGGSVLNAESFRSRLREAGRGPDAAEVTRITRALADLTGKLEAAEHRSTLAISGIDQQAMGVLSRLDGIERDQTGIAARFDGALDEVRDAQAKLADRLRRMDADDGPRVEALKALEGALGKVAAQIYEGESRARAQGAELREDVTAVARRVDRIEGAPAPVLDTGPMDAAIARMVDRLEDVQGRTSTSVRALETSFEGLESRLARVEAAPAPVPPTAAEPDTSAFDAAIARLAQRMDEAQERTSVAVRELKSSFAGLDRRLVDAEARGPQADEEPPQQRLEQLATELNARVDGAREEMAARLRDAADGKLDRMEAALRDLSGQVASTEQRSADAIDRLGREVVRIAQGLDGRMGEVERRSDARAAEMGGEMARIADAVENRLSQADGAQAHALEKLGVEIARIAEKLAERIAASERRNAQDLTRGLDDVGDRLQRATDKLNARYDSAASDLADRIRASEERTHRLLAEARERVETQPPEPAHDLHAFAAEDHEPHAESFAPPLTARTTPPHGAGLFEDDEDEPEFRADMFHDGADDFAPYEPRAAFEPSAFDTTFSSDPFAPAEPAHGRFGDAPSQPDMHAHEEPEAHDDPFAATLLADPEPEAAPRSSSTRELIEQARAAARANAEARGRRPSRSPRSASEEVFSTPAPGFEREAAAPERSSRFSLPKLRRREPSTAKTALYASGVAVTLTLAGLGAAMQLGAGRAQGSPSAEAPTAAPQAGAASPALLAVAQSPLASAGEGSVDTGPGAGGTAPRLEAPEPPPSPLASAPVTGLTLYNEAVRALARGDHSAVQTLKRAADQGYAPAQFHLGKLYEDGASGVKKNLVEARLWTERAAKAGDPSAMFNFGNYLAEGDGGAKDEKTALAWFRRAADAGVKDAQFDLGVMHQNGRGAPANAAEAYKWYLIAAADGDAGARGAAEALKSALSADAMGAAERSAAAYRAQLAAASARGQLRTAAR